MEYRRKHKTGTIEHRTFTPLASRLSHDWLNIMVHPLIYYTNIQCHISIIYIHDCNIHIIHCTMIIIIEA